MKIHDGQIMEIRSLTFDEADERDLDMQAAHWVEVTVAGRAKPLIVPITELETAPVEPVTDSEDDPAWFPPFLRERGWQGPIYLAGGQWGMLSPGGKLLVTRDDERPYTNWMIGVYLDGWVNQDEEDTIIDKIPYVRLETATAAVLG